MNTVGRERRLRIFKLLVEGVGVPSIERAVGVHRDTILRLLVNAGYNCDDFLDARMRHLRREHWEIDEMWTFCRKKEKRLTPDEKAVGLWGDQYLFLAIGQRTKLIPAFLIGKRNEANACKFMKDLAGRFQLHPILRHQLRRSVERIELPSTSRLRMRSLRSGRTMFTDRPLAVTVAEFFLLPIIRERMFRFNRSSHIFVDLVLMGR
jgi:hypothetical protein